jgi:hypothetical protein
MHVYGATSLITALDKIEYKAPQMNKLPESGKFKYDKEKQIISAKWKCENVDKTIREASAGDKVSLLVRTRNYEEGETISIDIFKNEYEEKKKITYTGTVNKEGFAELKEAHEIEEVKPKIKKLPEGKKEVKGVSTSGEVQTFLVDIEEKEKKSIWKSLFE